MSTRIEFDLAFGAGERNQRPRDPDDPLRILVVGDFGGQRKREQDLATRRIHTVDVDDFERALATIAPCVAIAGTGQGDLRIEFHSLDAFHPDSLYQHLDLFATLRDLRRRLQDPGSFEQASRELLASGTIVEPTKVDESVHPPVEESAGQMTDRLLGGRPKSTAAGKTGAGLDDLIRRLVEPHVKRDPTAGAAPYLAAIDEAATATMRSIMGAPEFKRLETGWRCLRSLVDNLELGESISLTMLDAGQAELIADLAQDDTAIDSTATYRRLADGLADRPPSVIVLDYEFGTDVEDLRLLAGLGAIAMRLGASIIGGAAANLLGVEYLAEHPDPRDWTAQPGGTVGSAWHALRQSAVARSIGLALPRILLRQPYGRTSDAIDSFDFEEIADMAAHDSYLWGNPAYASAMLIGRAFAENGWEMAPGDVLEVDDLPTCIVSGNEGRTLKPCAEVLLTERAIDHLLGAGLMPFSSYRDRNACRLARFQSIAEPPAPLSGPWST